MKDTNENNLDDSNIKIYGEWQKDGIIKGLKMAAEIVESYVYSEAAVDEILDKVKEVEEGKGEK